MDKNKEKLELLSETFSKIFDKPIKFVNKTIDVVKQLDEDMTNFAKPTKSLPKSLHDHRDELLARQKKLDRAENFYNSLRSTIIVMNSEIHACNDIIPHLDGYDRAELDEEINNLQESINWTMDAFALAIADCLDIDHTRDDYFNIFYDAITKGYGFDWMIEKLKKEGVV